MTVSAVAETFDRWHPAPGAHYFRTGDEVRVDGERGSCYRIRSFSLEGDQVVVELFGSKKPGRASAIRTVYAARLRRR